jgi:hypothetical protein
VTCLEGVKTSLFRKESKLTPIFPDFFRVN